MKSITPPLVTGLTYLAAVVGYGVIALLAGAALTACGGGDDEPDPRICYVEGKPMPPEACR